MKVARKLARQRSLRYSEKDCHVLDAAMDSFLKQRMHIIQDHHLCESATQGQFQTPNIHFLLNEVKTRLMQRGAIV